MNINELFVYSLQQSFGMLENTLADMSDADLMTRPVPSANHANWQIGHMLATEVWFVSKIGGKAIELPAGFAERYTKETSKIDDASKFAKKEELLSLFKKARAATIELAKATPAAAFSEKGPMDFVPTKGSVFNLASMHIAMHLGQIQVLRRKLGKPILF